MTVSDIRLAPVGEDLTKEEGRLSILRGLDKMHRVDKPVALNQTFEMGEWAVLGTGGKVSRAGASASPASYLVFAGTDRFDAKGTGKVTLVMAAQVVVKTTHFDPGGTYLVGDYLTVKEWGAGKSSVTPVVATDHKAAKVLEVGTGYLVYETLSN